MSIDVYPLSNLAPNQLAWARRIQQDTIDNSAELRRLNMDQAGNNRASAGQLGQIGRTIESVAQQQIEIANQQVELAAQVQELDYRSNTSISGANISTAPPAGGAWSFATRDIVIPGRGGVGRMAFIALTANMAVTGSGTAATTSRITQGGTVLDSSTFIMDTGVGFSSVVLVPAGGTTIQFRIGAQRQSGTPTLTASAITMNVLYSGPA